MCPEVMQLDSLCHATMMARFDNLRIREWRQLKYFEPKGTLLELRRIETQVADLTGDERVRTLRATPLRPYNEWRQAALFCYGMSVALGVTVYFAKYEGSGYDYVTMHVDGDVERYTPLQLKELVPKHLNAAATLDSIIERLTKYSDGNDMAVAVHLNRQENRDLTNIVVPRLPIGELWLYWAASPDGSRWALYGDLLLSPSLTEFSYPRE